MLRDRSRGRVLRRHEYERQRPRLAPAAILAANANEGAETITFAIPGSGRHTITVASALPAITESTTIDGTSQSGFVGTPLIELTGGSSSFAGLALTGHNAVVRSLALYGFQNAVEISGSDNRLVGSYIGLDGTGTARSQCEHRCDRRGGRGNVIGGRSRHRNIVSNSGGNGIIVTTATNTTIRNNLIGVNADGDHAMPNALNGT